MAMTEATRRQVLGMIEQGGTNEAIAVATGLGTHQVTVIRGHFNHGTYVMDYTTPHPDPKNRRQAITNALNALGAYAKYPPILRYLRKHHRRFMGPPKRRHSLLASIHHARKKYQEAIEMKEEMKVKAKPQAKPHVEPLVFPNLPTVCRHCIEQHGIHIQAGLVEAYLNDHYPGHGYNKATIANALATVTRTTQPKTPQNGEKAMEKKAKATPRPQLPSVCFDCIQQHGSHIEVEVVENYLNEHYPGHGYSKDIIGRTFASIIRGMPRQTQHDGDLSIAQMMSVVTKGDAYPGGMRKMSQDLAAFIHLADSVGGIPSLVACLDIILKIRADTPK